MRKTTLTVWIGCLECYNSGQLVGQWYDAITAKEVTVAQVHREGGAAHLVLDAPSPDAARWVPEIADDEEQEQPYVIIGGGHEELWCFDTENFGTLLKGECHPTEAQRIAELVEEMDDDRLSAFKAYLAQADDESVTEANIEKFDDLFVGLFDSEKDYAMEHAVETSGGVLTWDNISNWPFCEIDWRDAWESLDGYSAVRIPDSGGQVYIFQDAS